ncbi:PREDICTED: uncharacterized protein LOC105459850 isoform X1 [Wasmannia auropunctata]|uniref:uncharacterized protein LOC105459850 isoform X1 n=1 Tax=Wasmannia auropunctata TaxID=64793 RepID=UPI0005EFC73D|nr:PREDICTED: uncharacterized protein LOC105459850 isoform X1 [Wasmannia auropunctata]XP_011704465.1 PREDICTED: uncharacterized protein LOC105459850 isoform X1 [Wasmannia auropunctata]
MSRLKETQLITAISSSFYKNVLLLTQVVPPSVEFQRHFKKGMFDKPNTAGFLHVSHYLSVVCDAKLFKRMVKWPILCKTDEATYRVEMKSLLCVLSRDNPDLNFPTILMSHLIQSGGIKFQIIMWKLSQLALRTHVNRELQGELLNAPCTSPVQDLTIAYINSIIAQKCSVIMGTHKKTEKILKAANYFLSSEIERSNACKSEIFDRRENIKKLVLDLPAHPLIQKRLIDVEDSNVTDLWRRSIFKKIQYIYRKNEELNELEESSSRLCKLVLRINSNSVTIEAYKFPEIRCDSLLYTQSETQHLIRNLHANGSIVFSSLLSLLHLTFTQILHHHGNIADLSDLSRCLPFVQNACKKMKSLQTLFGALNTRIDGMCRNERYTSREIKDVSVYFDADSASIVNRNILLQSPKVSFNFNQCTDDDLFYERLCSSPTKGKRKHLFKRYKREYRPLCELPARNCSSPSSDLSNSWNSMSGWLSPRACSVKCEQISFKGKPLSSLYSRLLCHSKLHLKRPGGNVSRSPDVNYEGLNLTPRKRRSKAEHLITNDYGGKMKNLF